MKTFLIAKWMCITSADAPTLFLTKHTSSGSQNKHKQQTKQQQQWGVKHTDYVSRYWQAQRQNISVLQSKESPDMYITEVVKINKNRKLLNGYMKEQDALMVSKWFLKEMLCLFISLFIFLFISILINMIHSCSVPFLFWGLYLCFLCDSFCLLILKQTLFGMLLFHVVLLLDLLIIASVHLSF